jgi:hypothetical protein
MLVKTLQEITKITRYTSNVYCKINNKTEIK